MSLPVRKKYPPENKTITFEFADKLASGDSVSTIAAVTASAGISLGTPALSGSVVSVRVSGGTSGNDYTVTCQVNTTNGDLLELKVTVEIRDDAN